MSDTKWYPMMQAPTMAPATEHMIPVIVQCGQKQHEGNAEHGKFRLTDTDLKRSAARIIKSVLRSNVNKPQE